MKHYEIDNISLNNCVIVSRETIYERKDAKKQMFHVKQHNT